jgi:tRNA G18 (ribose-2'-O)-methylase SpoU
MHYRYLIISNVCKKNNIKSLINAAAAYGFEAILVGISNNIQDLHLREDIPYISMESLTAVSIFLKENNIPLFGIEILAEAKSVLEIDCFSSTSIAIMPGNEGTGMSKNQKQICDLFVYIPQYGSGTASLNVTIATTLVLHNFNRWVEKTEKENV